MDIINMQDFARLLVEAPKKDLSHDLRVEAMKSLFEGLTFNQATTTSEWDSLTCNEQMTIEDLIG
tara:strand:+ start:518 stop:712 length:195 start_codon:yes stop_codon:yes gene_type:complete